MRRSLPLRPALLLGMSATLLSLPGCATAQGRTTAPRARSTDTARTAERDRRRGERDERDRDSRDGRRVRVYSFGRDDGRADRAVIGLSPAGGAGKRDTLGVLVQSVAPGGPAEKAGIEEGDRIASINGVSLRLSPEDAGEPDVGGLMGHRLRREMDKVKPGDAVQLGVYSNGQTKTVRLTTVAADSLSGIRRASFDRTAWEDRAVIGLNVSASGSRRDTLGALVSAVATDGPAEKAGIVEGDRIASINGVDLRVAREDAGDSWAASVKLNRFQRELRKVKAGDTVELRVVTAGQARSVRVTAAKAKDVYKDRAGGAFFRFGDVAEGGLLAPVPAMPELPELPRTPRVAPLPPMPVMPPTPPGVELRMDDGDVVMLRDLGRQFRDAGERLRAVRVEGVEGGEPNTFYLRRPAAVGGRERASATLSGESGTVSLSGLRLSRVNADLASYFGKESEGGLLVTSSTGPQWRALRDGDVILSVNGRPVRQGNQTRISLDSRERTELEVLRKGKREKIVVDADR